MSYLSDYSDKLATILNAGKQGRFCEDLVALIHALAPLSDATVVYYARGEMPEIEYFRPRADGGSNLDLYRRGAFLLDPFYQAGANQQRFGCFRMRHLAPAGFRDSEYFRTFYRLTEYRDECGYVIDLGEDAFAHVSLGRAGDAPQFTRSEFDRLQAITPVVSALCRQHWPGSDRDRKSSESPDLRAPLQAALDSFGHSLLTAREAQVVNLILRGHSTRTVAELLSISAETVKLHRKHAYSKLDISSQAELFHLFLDSLMSANDYQGGDTLTAYLQPAT